MITAATLPFDLAQGKLAQGDIRSHTSEDGWKRGGKNEQLVRVLILLSVKWLIQSVLLTREIFPQ